MISGHLVFTVSCSYTETYPGVLAYECIHRCIPYPDMDAFTAAMNVARKGLTLPLPDKRDWPELHIVMQKCFQRDPRKRPSADEILNILTDPRASQS